MYTMQPVTVEMVIKKLEVVQNHMRDAHYKAFAHEDHRKWHNNHICCQKCYEGGFADAMGAAWHEVRTELKYLRKSFAAQEIKRE